LLAKEKELTRARDALSAARRQLPWVRIDKTYVFETPQGNKMLTDLFDGRSQLIVNHFMMGPGWKEGCVGCSFGVDHIEGALVHLEHHDVTYVAVSRAPLPEIEAFKQRMGWTFRWVSSYGSDFNLDFHVSFTPEQIASGKVFYNYGIRESQGEEASGLSVFYRDESGEVFHTYSSYARGNEELLGTYVHLDITPKGRNENGPHHSLADWVRHHDRYDHSGSVDKTGRYIAIGDSTSGRHSTQEAETS
jgi:predicted dithiol-disulfide oxidoreductase (DUF899 family)